MCSTECPSSCCCYDSDVVLCCAQVTFTLLFCQRLVYTLLRRGLSGIGDVVELTAKLIEDSAASYIISNGGWVCHDM